MSGARFTVAAGEKLKPGDMVCIDLTNGKVRKAKGQEDKYAWPVPEDAYQEDCQLVIPSLSRPSELLH
jgi:hypothetical protein